MLRGTDRPYTPEGSCPWRMSAVTASSRTTNLPHPRPGLDDAGAAAGRLSGDLDWPDHGLCKQSDPEALFPEKGGSTMQAKAVCKRCAITGMPAMGPCS